MKRTAIRLAVAVATFLIGVSVAYLIWFARKQPAPLIVVSSSAPQGLNRPPVSSDAKLEEKSVEDEWAELIEAGGCLFGSEYYNPQSEAQASSNVPTEASGVFTNQRWQLFFRRDKKETVPFLVEQISDKSLTNLHVDPFEVAIKGEAAIYALQHILKTNWYELKEAYKVRYDKAGHPFTHQALLRQVIKTRRGTKEMQELWMEYCENHGSGFASKVN